MSDVFKAISQTGVSLRNNSDPLAAPWWPSVWPTLPWRSTIRRVSSIPRYRCALPPWTSTSRCCSGSTIWLPALFFLLVGLEVKREMLEGALIPGAGHLPAIAAVGRHAGPDLASMPSSTTKTKSPGPVGAFRPEPTSPSPSRVMALLGETGTDQPQGIPAGPGHHG